jgi:hypothetical protein
MAAGRRRTPNNYVAEWFGHVVWPAVEVDASADAIHDQMTERCPFLSSATREDVLCTKKVSDAGTEFRTGFCTASSPSAGEREDWLACPWRVFDEPFTLVREAIRRLYRIRAADEILAFPVTRIGSTEAQAAVASVGAPGEPRVFAFSSNPPTLGGEIDIPETASSPGNKVDVSIFEVTGMEGDLPKLGQSAIFEIQTADFHGSPLHAVRQLRQLGPPARVSDYHRHIAANSLAVGDRVEGPNKANIFKRTIYQMILKIQMAKDPSCRGFAVVLPEPVWRSWERHLGQPALEQDPEAADVLRLRAPEVTLDGAVVEPEPAWILVFRVDRSSADSPKPLEITKRIATDSAALIHFAFDEAPEAAIREGAMKSFGLTFKSRLAAHWRIS